MGDDMELANKRVNYKPLVTEFGRVPEDKRQEAVKILATIERLREPPAWQDKEKI